MRRWFFYLLIGLSSFGIGSVIAERFNRQTEKIFPNTQEVFKTRSFGNFREDIRRNSLQFPIENQPAVKKKSAFTCNNKILSAVLNDLRKQKDFDEDAKNHLEFSDDSDCQDILYINQTVDLNGDGINEFVVRGANFFLCGATGNCQMWIYKKSGNSYKKLLDTGGEILLVKKNLTSGYKNIFVRNHGSCASSYQTTYKFNRGKYEESQCLFVDDSMPGSKYITTCAKESARIEEEYERQKNLN